MESYFAALKQRNLTEEKVVEMCREMNADGNTRIPAHVIGFAAAPNKVEVWSSEAAAFLSDV